MTEEKTKFSFETENKIAEENKKAIVEYYKMMFRAYWAYYGTYTPYVAEITSNSIQFENSLNEGLV